PHEGTLTGDSKYGRVPMNLDIPDTRQVLDIDRASEFLKVCRRFAVVNCICREARDLQGGRECDYPKDVCLLFDESADGAIAWEMGREITYDEALEIIKDCRELGLVQVISNAEHPLAMCNCCDCCCLCLRTAARNESSMLEVSRFTVDVINQPECIHCGACTKICPNNAIEVHDHYISANPHKCYGCGLCVSKCPKAVLRMVKKPGAPDKLERQSLKRIYM
ncbi:MAG: 4Fe-4S binding protein, partial [Eubacterium sp.]|nr:4Fe-4S binding protein [Candidatus Colimonas fimequi]